MIHFGPEDICLKGLSKFKDIFVKSSQASVCLKIMHPDHEMKFCTVPLGTGRICHSIRHLTSILAPTPQPSRTHRGCRDLRGVVGTLWRPPGVATTSRRPPWGSDPYNLVGFFQNFLYIYFFNINIFIFNS